LLISLERKLLEEIKQCKRSLTKIQGDVNNLVNAKSAETTSLSTVQSRFSANLGKLQGAVAEDAKFTAVFNKQSVALRKEIDLLKLLEALLRRLRPMV
jgi:septal ring factor EnvC (AmiA/AmiB activator)